MKNRKLLPKERIIFDNYNRDFDAWKKNLFECGKEYESISENSLQEMFWNDEQFEFGYVMDDIDNFYKADKYILFGSIGRWNGVHSGAKIFDSVKQAIYWAVEDCGYIKLYDVNGHFHITCSHHDGTNSFEIKEITDDGIKYLENWENNWNDKRDEPYINSQIIKRYSRNINFAHRAYGCKVREYEPQSKEKFISMLNNQAKSNYA